MFLAPSSSAFTTAHSDSSMSSAAIQQQWICIHISRLTSQLNTKPWEKSKFRRFHDLHMNLFIGPESSGVLLGVFCFILFFGGSGDRFVFLLDFALCFIFWDRVSIYSRFASSLFPPATAFYVQELQACAYKTQVFVKHFPDINYLSSSYPGETLLSSWLKEQIFLQFSGAIRYQQPWWLLRAAP